jgi:hypothetical protein
MRTNSLSSAPALSLLERPDLPLPAGELAAGLVPAVVVGTGVPHPADVVEVLFRRDGGPIRALRAVREPGPLTDPVQWFRALLPAPRPGGRDEYRVELRRSGQCVASLPKDGSWYDLIGAAEAPPAPPPGGAAGAAAQRTISRPRFAYEMEFFATLTVGLRASVIGPTPDGFRANFLVTQGRILGPRVDAEVLPEGGDWMYVRPDGIGAVHVQITWRTTDGALILDQAGGVFDLGPDGYAKIARGDFTGSPPLYVTPKWSTSHPRWQWLNRCQGIGFGRVVLETLQVHCDLYLPRVGEWLSRG